MKPTLEVFKSQIIILGNFNPPVISPAWLTANQLIGADDEKSAMENESLAITPDISRFETDWFWMQVVSSQFSINSKGPVTPAIRDLAVGVFSLLEHTPLTAMGLNSLADYKVYSIDEYHKIGDVLAPKTIWNKFYPESDNQNVGLEDMSLSINPSKRGEIDPNSPAKRIAVSVSKSIPNGIHFRFNHHFPLTSSSKNDRSTNVAIETIGSHWQSSMDEAKELFSFVLDAAIAN